MKILLRPINFAALLAIWSGEAAYAQSGSRSEVDSLIPTAGVSIGVGYAVHKSDLVISNDTAPTVFYGLSLAAGANRTTSVDFRGERTRFVFKLNDAAITAEFMDIVVRQRFKWAYAGMILNHSGYLIEQTIEDENGESAMETTLDLAINGYGGNAGVAVPIAKMALVTFDLSVIAPSKTFLEPYIDGATNLIIERDIEVGNRMDADIKGNIQIFAWLAGSVGLRWRNQTFQIDHEQYREQTTVNYLGLQAGWQF